MATNLGKEEGNRTGHLCTYCGYQRERRRETGQVIFVLSVVTKGKGRGVQDRTSLYFLWLPKRKEAGYRTVHISYQREKNRGTGHVIFVLSVVTKGKGRWVQDMSSVYFLWLPKGNEEGYRTGHLCTFCGYQREKKMGTIQDWSSLYFLQLPKGKPDIPFFTENNLSLFAHVLYFYPLR